MSRRFRPSRRKTIATTIAVALLLLLGGIAADHRSHSGPPAPRAAPPAAGAPGHAAGRQGHPRSQKAAPAARTLDPRTVSPTDTSMTSPAPHPSPARPVAEDPSASVELVAPPERTPLFRIRGRASGRLAPGRSVPVDLVLTNPHAFPVSVMSLTLRVRSIRAPHADAGHPCTLGDFAVTQYSGPRFELSPGAASRSAGRVSPRAAGRA